MARLSRITFAVLAALGIVACTHSDPLPPAPREVALPGQGTISTPQTTGPVVATPHKKVGQPYKVAGIWYYPEPDTEYDRTGIASWYGPKFHGKKTANGEIFDMNRLTAAHPTLPMPSTVRVTNLENDKQVVVRLNDRGPFAGDRIIDMSRAAAEALGFRDQGLARVRVEYLGEARLADAITSVGGEAAPVIATADGMMDTVRTRIATGPEVATSPAPTGTASVVGEMPSMRAPSVTDRPMQQVTISTPATGRTETPDRTMTNDRGQTGLFLVQIGAYSSTQNALNAAARFEDSYPVRRDRVTVGADKYAYRVRLGPFTSAAAANDAKSAAKSSGFADALIVVLD